MNTFHIDMNMAQYQAGYLKSWLAKLAQAGYDSILWEVENNVRWETCPECVSPDAFTKDEFREILAESRSLGLEPIPLFQTIGHAEYVLKHPEYAHLKEVPDAIDQYCPRNPEVLTFLHRWIEEYLDLFGPIRLFHIGADEAYEIGACPQCSAYASEHSISRLYIDHINRVIEPLVKKGVTPGLWADMVLHYPEALDLLSRDCVLFDWIYSVYAGSGKVHVWNDGLTRAEDFKPETLARFGPYLYPQGDEPGREPEPYYTADYLAAHGFRVVTCPSSSSNRDNVFTPRTWLHLANTMGWFIKGRAFMGSVLTSWSMHLFPWELQWSSLHVPTYLKENPAGTLNDYPAWFTRYHFGTEDTTFWHAAGLLAKSCLFTYTNSLGFSKDCLPVASDHVARTLTGLAELGKLDEMLAGCRARLDEYSRGREQMAQFTQHAAHGQEELAIWDLEAANLITRARSSAFLIEHAHEVIHAYKLTAAADRQTAQELFACEQAQRAATTRLYEAMIRPTRREEMMEYAFGAVTNALSLLSTGNDR
jgi:hypothetical protein